VFSIFKNVNLCVYSVACVVGAAASS